MQRRWIAMMAGAATLAVLGMAAVWQRGGIPLEIGRADPQTERDRLLVPGLHTRTAEKTELPVGQSEPDVNAPIPECRPLAPRVDDTVAAPLPPVEPWTGIDLHGRLHRLGEAAGCRAVAVVFLSVDCPISNGYLPELNRLAEAAASQGCELYGVISDRAMARDEALRHRREYEIAFPVLFDVSGELRERLQPTHVPEAFVLDAAGRVRYRGRIDDRYPGLTQRAVQPGTPYLKNALRAVMAGDVPQVAATEPVGCLLESAPAADAAAVTYCREIAPILQAHCVTCHRPGEVAPFSLMTYDEVRRHARQIRVVTTDRVMPPWKPVHGFGHFLDERRLSDREIELIAAWADAGAPEGNPADLPPPPHDTPGWRLGPPDLVLEMPEAFEVPADGNDIYQYFAIPTGLTEDRFVTAVEFRPSNPRVVHHAGYCFDVTGTGRRLDDAEPGPGYRRFDGAGFRPGGTLGGWGPGNTPRHLPRGLGRRLPKGSDLMLQIHYHPVGKPERDRSVIGLHFADDTESVRHEMAELLIANYNLRIPAGAADFVHRASYTLPVDVAAQAAAPHMHLLGHEFRATATRPDGSVVPLIRIDRWDFNWQDYYVYAQPVPLPAGTRIDVECRYDNSAANPFNPHQPPRPVRWGEGSTCEMGILFLDVTSQQPADLEWLRAHNQAYVDQQLQQNPWALLPPDEISP